jgi:hypothetical protein
LPALLIHPGQLSEPVMLQDVLAEAHEANRRARDEQIEKRKRERVPLDDTTDWKAVDEIKARIAGLGQDSPALFLAATDLRSHVEGNALEPIGPYQPNPDVDGVKVTFRIVTMAENRMWSAEIQSLWAARRDAFLAGDVVTAQAKLNAIDVVAHRVIAAVVAKLEGVDGFSGDVVEDGDALEAAGLATPLYTACRHFLDLPRGKALRCGVPPQST